MSNLKYQIKYNDILKSRRDYEKLPTIKKRELERKIYDIWKYKQEYANGKVNLTRDELYDVINKVFRLKTFLYNEKTIKLTPLNIEIAMNNHEEVSNLVNDENVNEINEAGMTPLIEAVSLNNYEISKILLEKGANINGAEDFIPIIIAAENHNSTIIKLLLQFGASSSTLDKNGFNALHHMFINGTVRSLQPQSIRVMAKQFDFATNFYKHPNNEQTIECIDLLVKNGLDVNYSPETNYFSLYNDKTINLNPLSLVLENSSEVVLKRLIELRAERKAIELDPTVIYEYQDSFDFIHDIMDGDLSLWPDAPLEYIRYLNYLKKIKKYNIEVYSGSLNDGYRRSKMIKKYTR